ncbi:MAG TPA: TIGR00341 family protein [Alphaproteobacteria bacterium]|jgi:uncharacterized hydrophobic protein (TIGR00341 family)|nr:TIGR00341 family protein [Alphaproteobacteria bacterium]
MTLRIVEVTAPEGRADTIVSVGEQAGAAAINRIPPDEDGQATVRILSAPEQQQALLDGLQRALGGGPGWRITMLPVEATIPPLAEAAADEAGNEGSATASREELYHELEGKAVIDRTFLLLVAFSTIVAAMGLLYNNVAVVIGAMVIAPLLGPNVAFAFATALGNRKLALRAIRANLAGILLALALAAGLGLLVPPDLSSAELVRRTHASYDSAAIALASGAAAVLSVASGLAGSLVGVMVAVALLPPTAAIGLMLGSGEWRLALGAGELLLLNIVCISLAAQLMFLISGLRPRTWLEQRGARRSVRISIAVWAILLAVLLALISVE